MHLVTVGLDGFYSSGAGAPAQGGGLPAGALGPRLGALGVAAGGGGTAAESIWSAPLPAVTAAWHDMACMAWHGLSQTASCGWPRLAALLPLLLVCKVCCGCSTGQQASQPAISLPAHRCRRRRRPAGLAVNPFSDAATYNADFIAVSSAPGIDFVMFNTYPDLWGVSRARGLENA